MKKLILGMAVASLIFASCSKETTTAEINENAGIIGFDLSTGKATKAAVSNLTTLTGDTDGFGVYATKSDGGAVPAQVEFIDNVAYIYNSGESKWEWDGTPQEWPNTGASYPINFYAYHPVSETTLALATLTQQYTISTTMSAQKDLLAANKLGVTTRPASSNVTLDFKHILSQVKFQIQAGTGMTVELQSIEIVKAGNVRTFDYSDLTWDGTAPTGSVDFTYVMSGGATGGIDFEGTNPSTAANVTVTDGGTPPITQTLMLIPQSFTAWDKTAATLATASYIEVVYRMTETASPYKNVVGYTDATDHPQYTSLGSTVTGNLFVKVGYPINTTWAMGKSYTYTINLGTPAASGGNLVNNYFVDETGVATDLPVIHPDTEEDIDVPEPIVDLTQPIDFILSVGDWIDATGISLE
ncbi:MAG: fimbrillin family protein [Rikenellaceae bacterium]|jgi:hypothetical protein|nr:fimbrillin family protein [Rikenellaceae bacterium]